MIKTEIAWTDSTFNPWWGCAKVSDGCKNCYAETFSRRVGLRVWGPTAEHRRFGDKHWNEPRKWNADALKAGVRRRVFCASMADVFEGRDEDAADRARLFALIEETPWLDWLLLTKRPENMVRLAPASWAKAWPRNVWAGCTVENADNRGRLDALKLVPATIRFISAEPLLGPLDEMSLDGIDWIIVGGESGPGARPMALEWARSIADQCAAGGVAYFFKQGGLYPMLSLRNDLAGVHPTSDAAPSSRRAWDRGEYGQRIALADRKGGDVDELARLLHDLAAAGTFRREWPAVRQ